MMNRLSKIITTVSAGSAAFAAGVALYLTANTWGGASSSPPAQTIGEPVMAAPPALGIGCARMGLQDVTDEEFAKIQTAIIEKIQRSPNMDPRAGYDAQVVGDSLDLVGNLVRYADISTGVSPLSEEYPPVLALRAYLPLGKILGFCAHGDDRYSYLLDPSGPGKVYFSFTEFPDENAARVTWPVFMDGSLESGILPPDGDGLREELFRAYEQKSRSEAYAPGLRVMGTVPSSGQDPLYAGFIYQSEPAVGLLWEDAVKAIGGRAKDYIVVWTTVPFNAPSRLQ